MDERNVVGRVGFQYRRLTGKTEDERHGLAERVGITLANMSILKTGKAKALKITTLAKLCEALDCQPGDLWNIGDREAAENETRYVCKRSAANKGKSRAAEQLLRYPVAWSVALTGLLGVLAGFVSF